MKEQKTLVTILCHKCGKRAALWKYPDEKDELDRYEVTCIFCEETTGWISGMLAAIKTWNEGKTHPSESFIAK